MSSRSTPSISPRRLRICLAQMNTTVGDFETNREKIRAALGNAGKAGAQLVLFPELAISGYPPEDLLLKDDFISRNIKTLQSVAPYTKKLLAVVGFVDRGPARSLWNAAAFILNGKIIGKYHKQKLPNYGVFDEKRYFSAGAAGMVLDISGIRLGISICEDIWLPDSLFYRKEYCGAVSALINISASPYHQGKQKTREELLKRLARRTRAVVLYNNLIGGQDELVFDGGSAIVHPTGKVLAGAERFKEELLFADVSVRRFKKDSIFPPGVEIIKSNYNFPMPKFFKAAGFSKKSAVVSGAADVYQALLLGTRDYVRKNNFQKALVGLSGGIDSALVACIAADALGPRNVIAVTMPSDYTSDETYQDARQVALNLGIECLEFKIQEILSSYLAVLKKAFAGTTENIAEENLQARIRGNILMALSNKFGHLVLTTGNKSEMATGYCTLYGDMAGGFAVIKDVPKTFVYKLSVYRNTLAPKNIIPASVLKRPPTAELRFNQKDQDTLPPYPILDRVLEWYVEKDFSVPQVIQKGVPRALAYQVARRVDRNEYKRRQAPPGIKITPKAFGRDRRMPITNKYAL